MTNRYIKIMFVLLGAVFLIYSTFNIVGAESYTLTKHITVSEIDNITYLSIDNGTAFECNTGCNIQVEIGDEFSNITKEKFNLCLYSLGNCTETVNTLKDSYNNLSSVINSTCTLSNEDVATAVSNKLTPSFKSQKESLLQELKNSLLPDSESYDKCIEERNRCNELDYPRCLAQKKELEDDINGYNGYKDQIEQLKSERDNANNWRWGTLILLAIFIIYTEGGFSTFRSKFQGDLLT